MRPAPLDAPLSVNWLPLIVSVESPVMLMQLIVPVYVPDRSVCSPPVLALAVAAAPAEDAAVARRGPRRRLRRPPLPLPFSAVPLMFVLSPVAAPVLASPV